MFDLITELLLSFCFLEFRYIPTIRWATNWVIAFNCYFHIKGRFQETMVGQEFLTSHHFEIKKMRSWELTKSITCQLIDLDYIQVTSCFFLCCKRELSREKSHCINTADANHYCCIFQFQCPPCDIITRNTGIKSPKWTVLSSLRTFLMVSLSSE